MKQSVLKIPIYEILITQYISTAIAGNLQRRDFIRCWQIRFSVFFGDELLRKNNPLPLTGKKKIYCYRTSRLLTILSFSAFANGIMQTFGWPEFRTKKYCEQLE
jgi:hypothetical protein